MEPITWTEAKDAKGWTAEAELGDHRVKITWAYGGSTKRVEAWHGPVFWHDRKSERTMAELKALLEDWLRGGPLRL